MRIILLIVLQICINSVNAKNYYFSSSSGNDSRTSSQAQFSATPWKTLSKLNSFFSSLLPGDSVLFKRGETFYGLITVNKSGSCSLPIVISAYGTGNKPVITGLQTLSNWASIGGGKYESYNSSLGPVVNIVTLNNVEIAMGRYPNRNSANKGYLNFESHGTNSITDNQLASSPSWTGAELVVRTNRYTLDRTKITSHSATKISYSTALSYVPINGFGYFIQNDIRTLDQLGEWYYHPSTKKITVYFGAGNPSSYSVKTSAVNNVVYNYNFDNIVLDNLNITGGNAYGIYLYSTDNIYIKNCDLSFSGIDGISANNTVNLKIEKSTILYTNNIAINLSNATNGLVKNNYIRNTGMHEGMGQNSANKSLGIRETGKNNLIEYNQIDSTGYIGIRFGGNYTVIKNNLVNQFNLTKDDGSGIYTNDASVGRKITGNIVVNGMGAAAGTNITVAGSTSGIYLDDDAGSIEVTNNTVANCNKAGIFVHNAHEITIMQNTLFDNRNQQLLLSHNLTEANSPALRNNIFKNNILFSKDAAQGVLNINTINNDVALAAGTMDNNYYCRPLDDNFIIKTSFVNSSGTSITQDYDLKGWQTYYKKDIATIKTAVQIMPYKLNSFIGSNKFVNGGFNTNISGTNIYSTGTSFTKTWINNKIDGGTLQVVTSSTKPGITTATIVIGAVSTTKKYIIGFSVKNSKDTIMYAYARQAGAPYKVLSNGGVKNILRMNSTRKDYELAFIPTSNEANTTIFLETPSQATTWWLDNIKVYEANVSLTNPNDSIRFEYNASQSVKTVALGGIYTDVKGIVYSNSLLLQPYSSAVIIKKNGVGSVAPTVIMTSPAINSKYTAPATVTLTATAINPGGTISKVEFYNGTKLILTEYNAPYTMPWKNVAAGNYVLTAKATDNNGKVTVSSGVSISVVPATLSLASANSNSPALVNDSSSGNSYSTRRTAGMGSRSSAVNFKLFPNPAINKIQIYFDEVQYNQKANVSIVDLSGKTLKNIPLFFSGQQIEVNVSTLTTGLYILRYSCNNLVVNKKFIKTY